VKVSHSGLSAVVLGPECVSETKSSTVRLLVFDSVIGQHLTSFERRSLETIRQLLERLESESEGACEEVKT
jgi:hypothetical protein